MRKRGGGGRGECKIKKKRKTREEEGVSPSTVFLNYPKEKVQKLKHKSETSVQLTSSKSDESTKKKNVLCYFVSGLTPTRVFFFINMERIS